MWFSVGLPAEYMGAVYKAAIQSGEAGASLGSSLNQVQSDCITFPQVTTQHEQVQPGPRRVESGAQSQNK